RGRQVEDDVGGSAGVGDRLQAGVGDGAKVAHHDGAVVAVGVVVGDGALAAAGDDEAVTGGGRRGAAVEGDASGGDHVAAQAVDGYDVVAAAGVDGEAAGYEREGNYQNPVAATQRAAGGSRSKSGSGGDVQVRTETGNVDIVIRS